LCKSFFAFNETIVIYLLTLTLKNKAMPKKTPKMLQAEARKKQDKTTAKTPVKTNNQIMKEQVLKQRNEALLRANKKTGMKK
jgi:hypothetical protein